MTAMLDTADRRASLADWPEMEPLERQFDETSEGPTARRRSRVWRAVPRAGRVWRHPAPRRERRWSAAVAGSVVATVAAGGLALLEASEAPDAGIEALPHGSMHHVVDQVGARSLWTRGITGDGVTIALIDTGVAPVEALAGKVRLAVDFTDEQGSSSAFVDTYGHGTHMAGIMAGRSPGADLLDPEVDDVLGIAPDASIASFKVAGADGVVTLDRLVAAIDMAVARADALDIGVLALAFDSGIAGPYQQDPLAAALERAWRAGIVVVTAAGNEGAAADGLSSPAHDPYVIAVGAVEATDTGLVEAAWSSHGDGMRNPDVAAPGAHIRSLRAPGSSADRDHAEGFVDDQLFLGSGSSQAMAAVTGGVALMLSADPELTPDAVKARLIASAEPVAGGSRRVSGAGAIDVEAALGDDIDVVAQRWTTAVAGAQQASALSPTGTSWTGTSWTGTSWTGTSWTGTSWTGTSWTGTSWTGTSWTGTSWTGTSWTGTSWTGTSWTGTSWTGTSWTGTSWTGTSWTGTSWTGTSWT